MIEDVPTNAAVIAMRSASVSRKVSSGDMAALSHPPLEGGGSARMERSEMRDGVGGRAINSSTLREESPSPHPAEHLAMLVDPPPPGEGNDQIRFIDTETFGPFLMVW